MRFLPVLFVVVLLPLSQATDWTDGGSGGDVSGDEATPYLLAPGAYAGRSPASDVDWYKSPSGASPMCARLGSSNAGGAAMTTQLVVGTARATADLAPSEERTMAIAGFSDATRFMFANAGSGQTKYLFDYSVLRAGESFGDAGSGMDAGNSTATATPISPGCIGGTLGGVNPIDTSDIYRFDGNAADIAILTLASNAPNGLQIDLSKSGGQALGTLMTGQSLTVTLPATGTYFLTASAIDLASSQYVMALAVGPPGQGCRPMCLVE